MSRKRFHPKIGHMQIAAAENHPLCFHILFCLGFCATDEACFATCIFALGFIFPWSCGRLHVKPEKTHS